MRLGSGTIDREKAQDSRLEGRGIWNHSLGRSLLHRESQMIEPCATSFELPPLVRSVFCFVFCLPGAEQLIFGNVFRPFSTRAEKEILDYLSHSSITAPAPVFEVLRHSGANSPIGARLWGQA